MEAEALIPDLRTGEELNQWELANILKAQRWAFARRRGNMLTRRFMAELHGRMFDETWTWAGEFRRSDKNIGVHWPTIEPALQDLIDDTAYQLDASTYPPDEILARFHHRLVTIHAFPNGNGRHARLMTDLLAAAMGRPALTWGRGDLIEAGDARARYLAALRQADRGRISVLLDFMRS